MANKIKLGYWGIRGRAQNSRLLLAYTGADWEDVKYADPNQWFGNDKIHLGLEFPNLPYLIEGDLKISESAAIERYIAQRSDKKELLGKDLADSARINQVNGVLADIRTPLVTLCFDKDYESKLKETLEKVKGKIELVNKYIGDKQWVLGYLTITDFYISELSYYL
jgi:glutathione S-transferase